MLKKRNRSIHQDQPKAYPYMSVSDFLLRNDFRNQKAKKNSVFNVPGLFVGLSLKGLFESDAAKSPTSTLDHRVLSSLGGRIRDQKSWDCTKVGLSIIDDSGWKVESRTKNIIFGPQLRIKPSDSGNHFHACKASKSLPNNYPVFSRNKVKSSDSKETSSQCIFEIGDEAHARPTEPELVEVFRSCSLDSSVRRFVPLPNNARKSNLASSLIGQKLATNNHFRPAPFEEGLKAEDTSHFCSDHDMSASADIELSEDYTCVITHGPNPKTTHIYSDCILGCHSKFPNSSDVGLATDNEQCNSVLHPATKCTDISALLPSDDFLSACYNCCKKLDGGDIFMYRGEKAFCSLECRESEIANDEDSDETGSNFSDNSPGNVRQDVYNHNVHP